MNKFSGFEIPKQNFSRLPHSFVELLPVIDSMAELKVLLYIIRHTWGFSEFGKPKRITVDEFCNGRKKSNGARIDAGTGLSDQSVRNGLDKAIEHGFLLVEIDDSDKARIQKFYCLNMLEIMDDNEEIQGSKSLTPDSKTLTSTPKNLDPVQRKKPEKEKTFKGFALSLENQIYVGVDTIVPFEPARVQAAVEQAFKINVDWDVAVAKYPSHYTPHKFMEWVVLHNITAIQIEEAAKVFWADRKTFWWSPTLKTIFENWPQLCEAVNGQSAGNDNNVYEIH